MGKDFKVTVFEGTERADVFMKVFGRREVCVLSPFPIAVNLPGFDESQSVYMLDLKEITDDERARLIADISERFGIDAHEVSSLLEQHGVSILMSECLLTIDNPQMWIDLDDDDFDDDDFDDDDFDDDDLDDDDLDDDDFDDDDFDDDDFDDDDLDDDDFEIKYDEIEY